MKYYVNDETDLLFRENEVEAMILKTINQSDYEDIIIDFLFKYLTADEVMALLPEQMQKDIKEVAVNEYLADDFTEVSAEEALNLVWNGEVEFANQPTK